MNKIIITETEKLNAPAKPLEFITPEGNKTEEGEAIIADLKETLITNNLLALSAPQIGIDARIFCIKFNDVIKTFINPIITKKTGVVIAPETCASMPGKEILISRPEEITVVYYNDEFKYEDNKLMGEAARVFDQQCQLLDGVLPTELGLVSDVETDGSLADLSSEEIDELIAIYKQFIAAKQAALQADIEKDEQIKEQYNKLKFTEDVINGRTLVVNDEDTKRMQNIKQNTKIWQKKQAKAQASSALRAFVSNKK